MLDAVLARVLAARVSFFLPVAALMVACVTSAGGGTSEGSSGPQLSPTGGATGEPAKPGATGGTSSGGAPDTGSGHVTYTFGDDVFRLEASRGATPQNVSALITPSGARKPDRRLSASRGGGFYVFETQNVDPRCAASSCLAFAPAADPSAAKLVLEGGNLIDHAESLSAISNDGDVVVFSSVGVSHPRDLFVSRRTGDTWSLAVVLTGASTFGWNELPSLHPDGTKVLFDCGPLANAGDGGSICEIAVDGTGFQTVVAPANAPASVGKKGALHHASYAPDGAIVFEADWDGERVWRKQGSTLTNLSTSAVGNDNSPCVLPDGRVVSLWLERPGNASGGHEIKIMSAAGAEPWVLLADRDVSDVGIGCTN